jgi:hypothetical protein
MAALPKDMRGFGPTSVQFKRLGAWVRVSDTRWGTYVTLLTCKAAELHAAFYDYIILKYFEKLVTRMRSGAVPKLFQTPSP